MKDLSPEDKALVKSYYEAVYGNVHYQGTLGWFTSRYHRELESHFDDSDLDYLDIGGGAGEHLRFVKNRPLNYTILDPSPSLGNSAQGISEEPSVSVKTLVGFGEYLPFTNEAFDRVVITCVLLHADDPVKVMRESYRVLKPGGRLSLYLPSDPGLVYRAIRHVTSHFKIRRTSGLAMNEVKYLWSLEHVNHAAGVQFQIRHVFKDQEVITKSFPRGVPFWNLNLYKVFHITKPSDFGVQDLG
jgi:phosphatidylethanolamine/phosphatidyl-N-methylethanolamine N-methyltransferase